MGGVKSINSQRNLMKKNEGDLTRIAQLIIYKYISHLKLYKQEIIRKIKNR